MPSVERTPQERETLVFSSPEEATAFREHVNEQLDAQPVHTREDRQIVADVIAQEFEAAGHPVGGKVSHPWEHSTEEHSEVEELVDVAFAQDLSTALSQAKVSSFYPRNIDLFHDVLTGELYEHVKESQVNKQMLDKALLEMGAIVLAAALAVIVIIFLVAR
jgi:hypothetical protein